MLYGAWKGTSVVMDGRSTQTWRSSHDELWEAGQKPGCRWLRLAVQPVGTRVYPQVTTVAGANRVTIQALYSISPPMNTEIVSRFPYLPIMQLLCTGLSAVSSEG